MQISIQVTSIKPLVNQIRNVSFAFFRSGIVTNIIMHGARLAILIPPYCVRYEFIAQGPPWFALHCPYKKVV